MRLNSLKNLIKHISVGALVFVFALPSNAQMTGNYTIDSSINASSNNFKNWYSFWRSLQGQPRTDGGSTLAGGISASIIVNVKSNLTDTSNVKLPAINGASSSKTITINGNGKFLAFAGSGEVLSFQGADHVTIQNLIIRHTSSSASSAICVRFYNGSDSNTMKNCTLEFSNISTGAKDGSAYVAFCSSPSNLTTISASLTGKRNTIKSNLCRTTNSSSPGPAFGFVMNGTNSGYSSNAQNNSFDSNTIQNFYFTAVQALYGNGNQFTRNNISRANATSNNCNTSVNIFKLEYSYASNREFKISDNYIHDMPYSGSTPSSGFNSFYGIYAIENNGNKNYNFIIHNNLFKNISISTDVSIGYLRSTSYGQITQNTSDKILGNTVASALKFWDIVNADELNFSGNKIINCDFYAKEIFVIYLEDIKSTTSGYASASDNLVQNNTFYTTTYILYSTGGNWKMHRNKLLSNYINGKNGGFLFCLMPQDFGNIEILNNLVANNIGEDGIVGIYALSYNSAATTFDCHQNTVYLNGSSISSGNYELDGYYLVSYYASNVKLSGNILELHNGDYGYIMGIDCGSSALKLCDNNTYYIDKIGSEYWFGPSGASASDFSGWAALGVAGSGENFINPKFADIANNDFHPLKWLLQNNVTTQAINAKDMDQISRNPVRSDRGVYEQTADIKAVSSTISFASSVCSGLSKKVSFKIQNLYVDTVYNFNVSYSLKGAAKTTQKVTKKLAPNDTFTVVFNTPLTLNVWGTARIAVFVDVPDDKTSNDSIIFTTTVNEAPGGRIISSSTKATKAIYKGTDPYAITIVGQPVILDITSPRKYTNADYGSKWNQSAYAITSGGRVLSTSSITLTNPTSFDTELKYLTTDLTLEDSIVRVCLKTTDLTNGCDTTFCKNIKINSKIVPKFKYPSLICGNDTAKFINNSTVKYGNMRFHWNFGTGKSKDTSNDSDPIFLFPGPGTYKVKLTAYTQPNGFESYDSATITVATKPVAKFARTNACEGHPIVFTNQSTPLTTSTYTWVFGDGTTNATTRDASHIYSPGLYTAKLIAKLNGCIDSTSLKVLEYAKPKANFTKIAGTCDNETIDLNNTTTYAGTYSSYWYIPGNSKTINTTDASYKFALGGDKAIKLVVKSEFGCFDSITKTVNIKEAPKVAFTGNRYCSIGATEFTNNTPNVANVTFDYSWNFGDGSPKSTAKSPTKSWATLGPKTVQLLVVGNNGCRDSLKADITVKVAPKVDFTASGNICSGQSINFKNNTTWAQGDISFYWNFGDGNSSTISDPSNLYAVKNTTTYFVYLIASIKDGCADSLAKSVTINALPQTCDFNADNDYAFGYYGMKFQPADGNGNTGAQSGISYEWNIDGKKINGPTQSFDFTSDGKYNVTMCAYTSTNPKCTCCFTKDVIMNRTNIQAQGKYNVSIYPNPNNGNFNIAANSEFGKEINVTIRSIAGAVVATYQYKNTGVYSLPYSDLANGIYIINLSSGDNIYTTRLGIRK